MTEEQGRVVEFAIGGMTCAACSARLEKVLNRQAGMQANVNLPAERARVRLQAGVDEAAVMAAVAKAGLRPARSISSPVPMKKPARKPSTAAR